MLQDTVLRLNDMTEVQDPIIICNIDHRFIVGEQMKEIGINNSKIIIAINILFITYFYRNLIKAQF